jgi:FkbH-like protein
MKLIEALTIIRKFSDSQAEPFRVALVSGFTPLHLQTFVHAETQQLFGDRRVEVVTGLYGNLTGTLETLKTSELDAVAVALEWSDVDPRLGVRQLGGWSPGDLDSILKRARVYLEHLYSLIESVSASVPVVLSLPTIPFVPIFLTAGWQSAGVELELKRELAAFATRAAQLSHVKVVNEQRLERDSPPAARFNAKSEWSTGFPYQLSHASALAQLIAKLIRNPLPKKGLITDLDNTLWNGIVGEVGAEGVSWDQDHHSAAHGFYQQMLKTLSAEGVLIAGASKNEPASVDEAFKREDLILPRESLSMLEVSWSSKAQAVSRILSVWNIGAESVVFVDDSPLELAEVKSAHTDIECLLFPYDDPQGIYDLVWELRDRFGREKVSEEDRLRMESIRSSAEIRSLADDNAAGFSDALLEGAEAEVTLKLRKDLDDTRAFELINKTNQFNLNGKRVTEAAWAKYLREPNTFMLTASYKDRFGTLGKIAVLTGHVEESRVNVDTWVMSCRAFARRIEHQCLKAVFEKLGNNEIVFDYVKTARNGPVTSFFTELLKETPEATFTLSRDLFVANCPALFHRVVELNHD